MASTTPKKQVLVDPGMASQYGVRAVDRPDLTKPKDDVTKDTAAGFTGRQGHIDARDFAATTHLETYSAFHAYRRVSGFSGHGYALVRTATGEVLGEYAFRIDALLAQEQVEAGGATG